MSDTLRGALWMLGTVLAFTTMAVSGREVAGTLDTFELMFYRSCIGVLIVLGFIVAQKRWAELRTDYIALHGVRNLFHFTGQNLWFFAVGAIPLAQVFALEFTSPLWVMLLSAVFLGERFTRLRAACACLGFIGILIVARPGTVPLTFGVITAASSAVFFALTIVSTKKLTQNDSVTCILFYLTTIQVVLGLIAAGYDGDIALPDARTLPFVVAVGIGGLVAHFCFTKALSLAPAALMSPIEFARLPAIIVVGWLLYGEHVDVWVIVGGLLIFGANYVNIWATTRSPKVSVTNS